jgi:hypothetical protein
MEKAIKEIRGGKNGYHSIKIKKKAVGCKIQVEDN